MEKITAQTGPLAFIGGGAMAKAIIKGIIGGGLIGSELAMDFCRAGKAVTVVDNSASVLASLMPPEVSSRLQHRLTDMGIHLLLKRSSLVSAN